MKDPYVGQKFLHIDGDDYIVAAINGKYSLICYGVHLQQNNVFLGCSYRGGLEENIDDVFGGNQHLFKPIH